MRVSLEANAVILRQAVMHIQEGTDIGDLLHLLPSKGQRSASESLVVALLDARGAFGRALVNAALEAGIPVDELARRLEESSDEMQVFAGGQPE
jgi:hypothetical protein